MNRFGAVVSVLLLAHFPPASGSAPSSLVLKVGTLIDVESGSTSSNQLILIEGENIFETLSAPPRPRDVSLDFEAALEKLPDGAREIFVLHDVDGYKHGEIAELLGISTGTSKAQLHRARMILRRHLR